MRCVLRRSLNPWFGGQRESRLRQSLPGGMISGSRRGRSGWSRLLGMSIRVAPCRSSERRQCLGGSFVMVVEKLCQLLAQALVLLALVTEQHGALEQLLLQILRQFAPQICRGSTEHEQIASGNVVDDLIRMLA